MRLEDPTLDASVLLSDARRPTDKGSRPWDGPRSPPTATSKTRGPHLTSLLSRSPGCSSISELGPPEKFLALVGLGARTGLIDASSYTDSRGTLYYTYEFESSSARDRNHRVVTATLTATGGLVLLVAVCGEQGWVAGGAEQLRALARSLRVGGVVAEKPA